MNCKPVPFIHNDIQANLLQAVKYVSLKTFVYRNFCASTVKKFMVCGNFKNGKFNSKLPTRLELISSGYQNIECQYRVCRKNSNNVDVHNLWKKSTVRTKDKCIGNTNPPLAV